jgi:hypothetical protein
MQYSSITDKELEEVFLLLDSVPTAYLHLNQPTFRNRHTRLIALHGCSHKIGRIKKVQKHEANGWELTYARPIMFFLFSPYVCKYSRRKERINLIRSFNKLTQK